MVPAHTYMIVDPPSFPPYLPYPPPSRTRLPQVTGDPNYFDFDAMQGYRSLEDSVELFRSSDALALTKLIPDLAGVDPDDAFR